MKKITQVITEIKGHIHTLPHIQLQPKYSKEKSMGFSIQCKYLQIKKKEILSIVWSYCDFSGRVVDITVFCKH